MAVTKIADVIQPELFAKYVIDRTVELSELIASGIITVNTELSRMVGEGGLSFTMPSWNDLSGQSQVMDDQNPIETERIYAKAEVATKLIRAQGWAAHELASALAGDSAFTAIGDLAAQWWVRDEQRILYATLDGIFKSPSMADLVHGDGTEAIGANFVLDAKQRLGDMSEQLAAVFMHSAVFTELQKQNLIQYIPNARGEIEFPRYLGYRVIVDDTAPVNAGVFTTYLFATGVIHRGEGIPTDLTPVETDRDSAMSTDYLFHRRAFTLHPMGVSWLGVGKTERPTPNNTELADGANWDRVRDLKKIGIVKMLHKIS